MRENESDSGDGWREPYDYARDRGGADQAPGDDPDLAQESDRPDTIAFGSLADETGGAGQGFYAQRGYGDPWYGGDRGEPGYGSYAGPGGRHGSESGGYGSGSDGSGSGSGDGVGSGGGDRLAAAGTDRVAGMARAGGLARVGGSRGRGGGGGAGICWCISRWRRWRRGSGRG